jgi:septum formation protein
MSLEKINKYHLILASGSPRRQYLLREIGIQFEVKVREVDEQWPPHLHREEIPIYLSALKAAAFEPSELGPNNILITADTIVLLNSEVVGKPRDRADAIEILEKLSGNRHEVITGVTLRTSGRQQSFSVESEVWFRKFEREEIEWYIDTFKPYDKAGAYGIQEWIGYVGIERIHGSFFNVMGLPTQRLYVELLHLIEKLSANS